MYAPPASATVVRWRAGDDDLGRRMRRRSSASACVRVSPSPCRLARLGPRRRLTRRPPTHHEPYQVSRPLPSVRTESRPVP